ncbi:uncharacterized protein LOC135496401 isoform X2 [Lineus longissimus]|uniref:uncharacterized protein LOC135496401 isoform X2 n=1 Tax=Lineus longissimus TaxID=88925 RepID=UPI002B4E952E
MMRDRKVRFSAIESETGPSGHKGHSILKKESSAVSRATSSDFDPDMGDYHSYRSTRSYDDDDFVTSKNRTLHRLAVDTLDDNDEIARRSRRHDQKLLSEITNKLNDWEVENQKPSYEVRERVGSSVRRNIDDTERRRAQLKNPILRRATHEKRASSYLDDTDDITMERPRSLNLSHLDKPAATLRQTYSPLRDSSPYASPFKYSSLADEFSTHKPYVRKYGVELTSRSTDLSSSPATRLGSELIRSATEHRPKPTYLDDDDLEEIDVENLFPKRRVIFTAPSDDEDDEPYVPPPTRTLNGTHSPGSYEYNYDDYEDEDSYLVEGDVHTRAGEICRRYNAGEGLYGHIDYHKRLYSDSDYSREYRRSDIPYDDFDAENDYVSPRRYKFSSETDETFTSPYKSYTSPAFDEEYTPSYKYRPSVAALDSKLSKLDTLPRSRLDQTEAWMAMQSNHRALEDREQCSTLDRIRVKAALIEKTLPATPRRKKFFSTGSYTGSSNDHGSSCISHVDYESGYTSKYGGHKSRETTRSDPSFKDLPASISPEPRKDYKPEYYVFSPEEERSAPAFDDAEETFVISAKKPTVVIDDEEDEPVTVSIRPAAEPQVAAEVAQSAESVVPLELEEHSPEKEGLEEE